MTNSFSLFRSLIIYSICLPLAAVVGYLLATTPSDYSSLISIAIILALMTIPMFLRWHYPWMLLTWNMAAVIFFLPGKPLVGILVMLTSFGISVLQYILNRQMKFISVPIVARPLLFLLGVVLLTARLTGGIGLNAMGGGNAGGMHYVALILAVIGFYALTAVRIPPQKRKLYVFLFYGGTVSMIIANLALVVAPGFSFIFLIFPTDLPGIAALSQTNITQSAGSGIVRLGGVSNSAIAVLYLMLAFYGLRGIIDLRRWWRLPVLLITIVAIFFGGYRSQVILLALMLGMMFYMEGLTKSRLLPMLLLTFIFGVAVTLPFADKMPLNVQRSLAFLPLRLDPVAVENAQASTDWRLDMWANLLPEVPKYLILGKGLSINVHDLDFERAHMTRGEGTGAGSALAGDYHSGPLSVIIPFGLFGVAGFVWFLVASLKVLYRNYKFGDPELLLFNRFLLAQFIIKIVLFIFIFGSFYGDLIGFVGVIGLSIALNHGVAKPASVERPVFNRFTRLDKIKLAGAAANTNVARG
jgi:hypothetical protein